MMQVKDQPLASSPADESLASHTLTRHPCHSSDPSHLVQLLVFLLDSIFGRGHIASITRDIRL
jgi:hypothetical protein